MRHLQECAQLPTVRRPGLGSRRGQQHSLGQQVLLTMICLAYFGKRLRRKRQILLKRKGLVLGIRTARVWRTFLEVERKTEKLALLSIVLLLLQLLLLPLPIRALQVLEPIMFQRRVAIPPKWKRVTCLELSRPLRRNRPNQLLDVPPLRDPRLAQLSRVLSVRPPANPKQLLLFGLLSGARLLKNQTRKESDGLRVLSLQPAALTQQQITVMSLESIAKRRFSARQTVLPRAQKRSCRRFRRARKPHRNTRTRRTQCAIRWRPK
mmetsp:Transcript_9127/g.24046  ORF Transcript_9127/g.24046 Transcript_9127/m.24046 type:complete len:265 (+) Transcript_9127:1721-2515(+)